MTNTPASTTQDTAAPKRRPLPGDRSYEKQLERLIRVDHAGEYGAVRIYEGQLAALGPNHPKSAMIRHMLEQEKEHLDTFNRYIAERGVRPTLLNPFWHVAGFALGAGTALLGPKAAMACTQAVEDVIDAHYQTQRDMLDGPMAGQEPELSEIIERFQAEELEHKALAEEHGAEDTPGHTLLSAAIKTGCKVAIWLAKRV